MGAALSHMGIGRKGFTIVELLVVVVVIGILASITIVAYGGAQNKARDASVRADLDSAEGLVENFRVAASNTAHQFPQSTTDLGQVSIKAAKQSYKTTTASNFVFCVDTSNFQAFAIAAESKSGTVFLVTQNGFQTTSLGENDFSDPNSICASLNMSLVSAGMSAPGTWQSWVNN